MPYQYLLDTNILSELLKHPRGLIFHRIETVGEDQICTSIVVASELRFGVAKKGSERLTQRLEELFQRLAVLPLQRPVDQKYGKIRLSLEQSGTPIGPNDLLIAAHTLTLDLTLVTANTREFERIPNLKLANWLR